MRWRWTFYLALLFAGSGGPAGSAMAQGSGGSNSSTAARMLLPFEGGSGRPVAMALAEGARVLLGRPVVVEVRPGASGRIAAMALKGAAPDGSTVALLPIAVPVVTPLTLKDVPFDAVHDFAPISQVATYEFAFAVPGNHPARSIPEFVAWLKTHPSDGFYGSPGAGTLPHFLGAMVSKAIRLDMTHVAYKGAGAMKIDLAEGTIPSGVSVVSDLIEMHRAGRIRILATSGTKRLDQLQDVATFAEQGYPTIVAKGWVGVFAPGGTPKPVIDQWAAAVVATVRSPQMRRQLIELGVQPTGTTPQELAATVAADIARWGPVIKASGFRGE